MADLQQKDLAITRRSLNRLTSDREQVDLLASRGRDVATVTGIPNLVQAVINRLFTRKGELTTLGHPAYGSRLYLLIGELNNNRTRIRAEYYIRECLMQESRIEEVRSITFAPYSPLQRDTLDVTVAVKPVGMDEEIRFAVAVRL
jgi:phage gp46-like protein